MQCRVWETRIIPKTGGGQVPVSGENRAAFVFFDFFFQNFGIFCFLDRVLGSKVDRIISLLVYKTNLIVSFRAAEPVRFLERCRQLRARRRAMGSAGFYHEDVSCASTLPVLPTLHS